MFNLLLSSSFKRCLTGVFAPSTIDLNEPSADIHITGVDEFIFSSTICFSFIRGSNLHCISIETLQLT